MDGFVGITMIALLVCVYRIIYFANLGSLYAVSLSFVSHFTTLEALLLH